MSNKSKRPAQPVVLWAPIAIGNPRCKPWIMWDAIRGTRKEAKRAYLENLRPEYREQFLRDVRFAKVLVTEWEPQP